MPQSVMARVDGIEDLVPRAMTALTMLMQRLTDSGWAASTVVVPAP
jgi:hypothetical protein